MQFYRLILGVLAVWRVTHLLHAEAGPWDVFERARRRLGEGFWGSLTSCFLCLSLWGGTWLGVWLTGMLRLGAPVHTRELFVDPRLLGPSLCQVGALLFAVSGYTMWLSARGRFRGRVMAVAVLITLLQFLVNVIGQLWDTIAPLRQLTIFYYYQPQQIILENRWTIDLARSWHLSQPLTLNVMVVLVTVGLAGYGLALWKFCRRDLPAPL